MCWKLNAHKTIEMNTPEKWTIISNKLWRFSELKYIMQSQPVLAPFLQQTGLIFENHSPQRTERDENSLCSWPFCLPSEIFCIKPVIVACLCAVSNSGSAYLYEQREQATKKAVIQNISLERHRMSMNEWSHENVKDVVSCHKTFECSKCVQAFHCFSLPTQHSVTVWTNVFCKMYRSWWNWKNIKTVWLNMCKNCFGGGVISERSLDFCLVWT